MHITLLTCFESSESYGDAAVSSEIRVGPAVGGQRFTAHVYDVGDDDESIDGDIVSWLAREFIRFESLPHSSLLKQHEIEYFKNALENDTVRAALDTYAAEKSDAHRQAVANAWRLAHTFIDETFVTCTIARNSFIFARSSTEGCGRDDGFLLKFTDNNTNNEMDEFFLSTALSRVKGERARARRVLQAEEEPEEGENC
jgi:hypothetical protein